MGIEISSRRHWTLILSLYWLLAVATVCGFAVELWTWLAEGEYQQLYMSLILGSFTAYLVRAGFLLRRARRAMVPPNRIAPPA
jgi:hypothetical protein